MNGEELAGSCFNAFRNAVRGQGNDFPEWASLDESVQAGFVRAAGFAEEFLSGEPDEAVGWRMFGLNCYWQFCREAGETPLEQDLIPADTARAWEAFGRHANNMMDFDAAEDHDGPEPHEAYWSEWAANKKAAAAMSQQEADARPPLEAPGPLTHGAPLSAQQPADAQRPNEEDV